MSHYHVMKNAPGYMPWISWSVPTRREAVALLKDEKRFTLDDDYEGVLRFSGDAERDLQYHVEDSGKFYDIGYYISATECDCDDPEGE